MSHHPHPPTLDEKKAMQAAIVAELEDTIREEIVAAQWFYAGGRWHSLGLTVRAARWATGRRRVDDGLAHTNALVVTKDRVLVFEMQPDETGTFGDTPAHAWPRAEVTGTWRLETLVDAQDDTLFDMTESVDVRRATLLTPDGVLMADLPSGDRSSQRVITALKLTKGQSAGQRLLARFGRS